MNKKQILILGAGFAGLKLARVLSGHPGYSITLIDKNNYHQFQPLLYQVATANLDASNISFPLRNIFKKCKNVSVRITEVTHIDLLNDKVDTTIGPIYYDFLVLATGAVTNYFGNAELARMTFPMKSTWEALILRNTLIQHFEDAVTSTMHQINKNLSVVIVGGGPTGVELSGAIAEMKRDALPLEYPELDFSKMEVYLIEGTNKLLAAMSDSSSQIAKHYLEEMGVVVKTNTLVKDYNGIKLKMQDGTEIESSIVIWAAGVKGNIPSGINTLWCSASNQIRVDEFNRVNANDHVFAIGDISIMLSELYPKGFPQLASVAMDQAKNLAINFKRMALNKSMLPFHYYNKGSMATVGRNKAVVDLAYPKWSFHGFIAWIIWMTLHLFLLISFKNRLIVFINWIYKYFTHRQSLCLLFNKLKE